MAKNTFKFDKETFEYNKKELTKKQKFYRVLLPQVFSGIAFGFLIFFFASNYLISNKAKQQQAELDKIKKNYSELQNRFQQADTVLTDIRKRDKNIHRSIFEAEPVDHLEKQEILFQQLSNMSDNQIINLLIKHASQLDSSINANKNNYDMLKKEMQKKDINLKMKAIPSIQPIYNPQIEHVPYGFGTRLDPIYRTPAFHPGIDFSAQRGTKVFATAPGIVVESTNKKTYGNFIEIDHGNGFKTRYAHLDERFVQVGQKVKRRQTIGITGNTGKSLVAHVHYEVLYKDENLNPVNFFFEDLDAKNFNKILELSMNSGLSLD